MKSSSNRKRKIRDQRRLHSYEALEERKMLASIYPAYVDGVFTLGNGDPAVPNPYPLNFGTLESNPGANHTIYLDVTGHVSVNNLYNHGVRTQPYDTDGIPWNEDFLPFGIFIPEFSDEEIIDIQLIWQAVAEDFAPFDVNVVTTFNEGLEPAPSRLSRNGFSDNVFGVRAVITAELPELQGSPGLSLMDTFNAPSDTPVFVFQKDAGPPQGIPNAGPTTLTTDEIAITVSHEVGHSLGIAARGVNGFTDHPGTGEGEITSWGPILGRPFGNNLVQWTDGQYEGSTNTTLDYDIITRSSNGFGFKLDDHSDTIVDAEEIDTFNGDVFQYGFIGDDDDQDLFQFETGSGDVVISAFPFGGSENLDIELTIYDTLGNEVLSRDPADNTWANYVGFLDAGVYYVGVDGTGLEGRYSDYGSVGFYTIRADLVEASTGVQFGESGFVAELDHNWQTVTLSQDYVDPVIVFGPPTNNGNHPVTIRLRNVTDNSFEVRIQEYRYLDVVHVPESVGYVVMEAGTYELLDGTVIRAANEIHTHEWESIDISESFNETPIVLTQVRSFNDVEPVTVRVRNVSDNGFQLRLQEEQALDIYSGGTSEGPLQQLGHGPETVSYIAIEPDAGLLGSGILFETSRTGVSVDHNPFNLDFGVEFAASPVLLAQMQTTNGGDTANIRLSNPVGQNSSTFFVQEEQSLDAETDHAFEDVGVFALAAGPLFATVSLTGSGVTEGATEDSGPSEDFGNLIRSNSVGAKIELSDLDSAYAQLSVNNDLGELGDSIDLGEATEESISTSFRVANDTHGEFDTSVDEGI